MNKKLIEKLIGLLIDDEKERQEVTDLYPSQYEPNSFPGVNVGDKILVRGDRSGVFVGSFVSKHGTEIVLSGVRWIWYWDGAASLFQLADEGVKKPENCKFPKILRKVVILDAIQIIPVSDAAHKSIMAVKVWEK